MFSIVIEFLTGRYRATSFNRRGIPEWPPHPDRAFQALVAAWAERGKRDDEREALEWLESRDPPHIDAPLDVTEPTQVKVFVPMNDTEASPAARRKGSYPSALAGLLPAKRVRKSRYFPSVWVGEQNVALVYPYDDAEHHLASLQRLAREVVRVGHSSSFVRCWIDEGERTACLEPSSHSARESNWAVRVPSSGRLATLTAAYDAAVEARTYTGTPRAREIMYSAVAPEPEEASSPFSRQLIVLENVSRTPLHVTSTVRLTSVLRGALIRAAESVSQRGRELFSGHSADGNPLAETHVAYLPLPFVGSHYADAHVLGIAIAIPAHLSASEEDQVFDILAAALGRDGMMQLHLSDNHTVQLKPTGPLPLQQALQPPTWTGPARQWSSVTPIVMDRMQNRQRSDPEGWAQAQVAQMCERGGLPKPSHICVSDASFIYRTPGVPQFPSIVRKDGSRRRMVHVRMTFDIRVGGPLVLGSGRFRGYGLCKAEA